MSCARNSKIIVWLLLAIAICLSNAKISKKKPCKEMVLFYHDIVYNGTNAKNATSAIVAAPSGNNLLTFADQNSFGNIVVFNDPITVDENLHSPHVAKAQGFFLFDDKDKFSAWFAFSLVFNSTDYQGTINLMGADPIAGNPDRDISIVGGTGDFFMHRGIATLKTDAFEGFAYFRLKFHLKFYECW